MYKVFPTVQSMEPRINACSVISVMLFIFNLIMIEYILLHGQHVLFSFTCGFCSIQYKTTLLFGMVARLRSRQLTSLLDQLESTAHWGSSFTQTPLFPLPLLPPLTANTYNINMPESSSVGHRKQQFQHTYCRVQMYIVCISIYSTYCTI
jgi:hypothetical protein